MSVIITSMINGGNFRVSWLSRILGHHGLRSSSACIMSSMIATFMIDSSESNWVSVYINRKRLVMLASFICFIVNYVIYLVDYIASELCCLFRSTPLKLIWLLHNMLVNWVKIKKEKFNMSGWIKYVLPLGLARPKWTKVIGRPFSCLWPNLIWQKRTLLILKLVQVGCPELFLVGWLVGQDEVT
jgi:hypothetical protein